MSVPAGWKVLTVGPFSQDTLDSIDRAGHDQPGALRAQPTPRLPGHTRVALPAHTRASRPRAEVLGPDEWRGLIEQLLSRVRELFPTKTYVNLVLGARRPVLGLLYWGAPCGFRHPPPPPPSPHTPPRARARPQTLSTSARTSPTTCSRASGA